MAAQERSGSTLARARVDRLIGRAFAGATILFTLEAFANFYAQLPLLREPWAWLVMSILWSSTAAFVFSFWFGSANYLYLRIHAIYIALLPIFWVLLVIPQSNPDANFYPYIWWAMSTGWLAAALSFKMRWVIPYFILVNLLTQYIFTLPISGSHSIQTATLDGLYTLLTNGSVAVIALMLRQAAIDSDQANSKRIKSAVLEAQVDAQAKERDRLDALVHDSVLTALISAGAATNDVEVASAAELATLAIKRLQDAGGEAVTGASVLCSALFDSIISAALKQDPKLDSKKTCQNSFTVTAEVASALTEATLQAVQNSLLHAGAKAKRELLLKSSGKNLKIVIKDDGVGFRPNRLPRGRLGVKLSIYARMKNVGGQAHIESAPRKGTTVVLEWSQE